MEKKGRYGEFGGQYAAETLMNALINLEEAFNKYKDDEDFNRELNYYHKQYTGRPSILYYAEKMTKDLGGAKIYLKREDLNHTGAHKINNVIGQKSLPKQVRDSTVLQLRHLRLFWDLNVMYIWVRKIQKDRHLMYFV